MSPRKPGVDDVYAAILERISAGLIEVGSKLPSCRQLAAEIGSNPSTTNRALRRLARHGLVRTEPRVGSYLVSVGGIPELSHDEVEQRIHDAVRVARRSGVDADRIRRLFESALSIGSREAGVVAFVECNEADLRRMVTLVENTTGVALRAMLIDDLREGWEQEIDVVATPVFHLADLIGVSRDMNKVVELNFVPTASVLRQLSTLRPSSVVAVAAPTKRGVERLRALVGQYYAGPILVPDHRGDHPYEGVDVVIHPIALDSDEADFSAVQQVIVIEWELDPRSAATFASRIAAAAARR